MAKNFPKVIFYVPSSELVGNFPMPIDDFWSQINKLIKTSPAKVANGNDFCTWDGPYSWTLQTYNYLQHYGFPCELTSSIPDEGIIISHGDFLPFSLRPSPTQFIVEIKPDRNLQCLFANHAVIQNKHDPIRIGVNSILVKSSFVHCWPQPSLISRDTKRGDRFENIVYMGTPEQFISETHILGAELNKIGLNWIIAPREKWNDYSEVDAIVAVRPSPAGSLKRNYAPAHLSSKCKPASKLINSWIAGVPAILSPETAYKDIRKSKLDYLEASNISEIIDKVKILKSDSNLRKSIVDNGYLRAEEFNLEKIAETWTNLILHEIIPNYYSWVRSSGRRKRHFFSRELAFKIRSRSWRVNIKILYKKVLRALSLGIIS